MPSSRGARRELDVSAEVAAGLRELARREGATLFMTLLAGWKALLHLESGQEDVRVGSGVANRDRRELESVCGFFVNTVVLRTRVPGDLPFRALVGRVREAVLEAHAHQDVPFERVAEALQAGRGPGAPPLFSVMFEFENAPRRGWSPPGLTVLPFERETRTAKFDLVLAMGESGSRLTGSLEYALDLFDPPTIDRLVERLGALLAAAASDPECPVDRLLPDSSVTPTLVQRDRDERFLFTHESEVPP